jgi:hypothetical protein
LERLGEFVDNASWEEWAARLAVTIAEFAKASAEGRRQQWLADAGFCEDYAIEGSPDASVIYDVISMTWPAFLWEVYRCPKCKRLYLPEAPGSERWLVYSLEESLEKPPWPNVENLPGTTVMRHRANESAEHNAAPDRGGT